VQVPLSGATLPGPVKHIDMEVSVGGRVFTQSFFGPGGTAPVPNQTASFTGWDGTDVYGRLLQGGQPVTVRVGNTYDGVYQKTSAFGYNGNGLAITGSVTRKEVTISNTWNGTIGVWDDRPAGVGGWTVNVNHRYDVGARTIHFGDGTELTPASMPG
jgi:hypothetical protein